MFLAELFAEAAQPQLVVFYPGRFQPFHLGHRDVFASLQAKFGRDAVYIATSNKVELPKSPFNFSEKTAFMNAAGVSSDRIIQVASPYKLPEQFDPATTIFVVALGAPDARRLSIGGTKKNGEPDYFQPFKSVDKCTTADKHGYVIIAEERDDVKITLLGQEVDVSHGTPSRHAWNMVRNDPKGRAEYLVQMFGRNDPELGRILDKIPAEQVTETIRRVKDGYRLVSHTGKNLGTYPSRAGAERRERQVQYFKHMGEDVAEDISRRDVLKGAGAALLSKNAAGQIIGGGEDESKEEAIKAASEFYRLCRKSNLQSAKWIESVIAQRLLQFYNYGGKDVRRAANYSLEHAIKTVMPSLEIAYELAEKNKKDSSVAGAYIAKRFGLNDISRSEQLKNIGSLDQFDLKPIAEVFVKSYTTGLQTVLDYQKQQAQQPTVASTQQQTLSPTEIINRAIANGKVSKAQIEFWRKEKYSDEAIADHIKNNLKEDAAGVGVVKNSKDPRYVMSTAGDQNDVTAETLPKEMRAYGLIGRKSPGAKKQ